MSIALSVLAGWTFIGVAIWLLARETR